MNGELKMGVIGLLEEVLRDPDLLPQERKATTNILRFRVCLFLSNLTLRCLNEYRCEDRSAAL